MLKTVASDYPFGEEKVVNDKVGDHSEIRGKHKEAAHTLYNLNAKQKHSTFIPIAMYIMTYCDLSLIFKELVN